MNAICSFVQFLIFHSFLSLIRSDLPFSIPLIFNTLTHEIYPNWESVPENGGPYAIACPTWLSEENKFEGKYSLNFKATLVQYGSEKKIPELSEKMCERSYRLSAALHSPPNTEPLIEFGYEVFFNPSRFKIIFKESTYKDFQRIREPSLMEIYSQNDSQREIEPIMKIKISGDERSTSNTEVDVKMGFVWISKIVVKYDISTLSMKNVIYYSDKTIDKSKLQMKCNNHSLDYGMYTKRRLYNYYPNQYQILKKVRLPVSGNSSCQSSYICLKKYDLLFPYQFQTFAMGIISCPDLTTIPLWYETIENLMDYLEKFLIAVTQVVPNKLKITLGVHETLSFPAVEGNEQLPIYLDTENGKFPAPKIIYRIISYQFNYKCESKENSSWFELVIVIHNQPEVSKDDIICEDRCKKWGWDSIQYLSTTDKKEENKSQFVYCCELDDKLRTLLNYTEDSHKKEDLNLIQFPYDYNENTKEIQKKNIQKEIEDKLDELLQK